MLQLMYKHPSQKAHLCISIYQLLSTYSNQEIFKQK